MKLDQRGFVLSGVALLLVLPAMLLAASCLAIIEKGGEATALQATADKVSYTGEDIRYVIKNLWDENLLFDNQPNANAKFDDLVENYRAATGLLVDITPRWMLWTRFVTRESHAGTEYCKIARIDPDNWLYYFEAYQIVFDYDDIVLRASKSGENLIIFIENIDPIVNLPIDVYYDNILLWEGATIFNVGENRVVAGITQLIVSINVRDPREAVRYTSTLELG